MKFLDYTSLLSGDPATIAVFSTYQFEPDFFEQRILKCDSLKGARRIVVFMDARQWFRLIQRDVSARRLNRRYLVVPVKVQRGVFHAKLNLLLTEGGGQLLCGSNNLTRAGTAANFELINSLPFSFQPEQDSEFAGVAWQAIQFFKQSAAASDAPVSRIAAAWLAEAEASCTWRKAPIEQDSIKLLHSFDRPIWDTMSEKMRSHKPDQLLVISPFHDLDGRICRQVKKDFPRTKIELVVQQGYTRLPVSSMTDLRGVNLTEFQNQSRRLHAKLFAWKGRRSSGCIVGSPNFTSAALRTGNIETALFIPNSWDMAAKLFDSQLRKKPMRFLDFQPGTEESPEDEEQVTPDLWVSTAVLDQKKNLQVVFGHALPELPSEARINLRVPGEANPRFSRVVSRKTGGEIQLSLPDSSLSDCAGCLLVSVALETERGRVESLPVWVVQEDKLTYEAGDGAGGSLVRIEETGEGLLEYLDELGKRDGTTGISEWLRNHSIRFFDGGGRGGIGARKFRIKITDPFESDETPEWLIPTSQESGDLREAILDFVNRHEKQILKKHAARGNINGLANYIDILSTLIKLLYVYYKRGVIPRLKVVGRLCDWCELSTIGLNNGNEKVDGYLQTLSRSLGRDHQLLQNIFDEYSFIAELRAMLLIAQRLRFTPDPLPKGEVPVLIPEDALPTQAAAIANGIEETDLKDPGRAEIRTALERYQMFGEQELNAMVAGVRKN
jgi:hypothetical protein